MKYPLILIVGQAGSGKDTFASLLANSLSTKTKSFALADPLKEFAKDLLGFSDDQLWGPSEKRAETVAKPDFWSHDGSVDMQKKCSLFAARYPPLRDDSVMRWARCLPNEVSARHVLQTLGTEIGRKADPNIWVNAAMKKADEYLSEVSDFVIITDGRFRNEILKVKERGGIIIKVKAGHAVGQHTHSSETEQTTVPDAWFDYIVTNNKHDGESALRAVAGDVANDIKNRTTARHTTDTYSFP